MALTLRPYQIDAIERTRNAFRAGHRRVILTAPTGAGKTVMGSDVITRAVAKGSRVLTLAHRVELLDQMGEKLDFCGVPHGVIKAGHPRQDLTQPVQVASVATLARRLDRMVATDDVPAAVTPSWQRPFNLIVVDECHHTPAGTYRRVLDAWPHARVLGLTATPYRLDGRGLDDCYDDLVIGIHVSQLIAQGHLVPTTCFAPPAPAAIDGLRTRAGDYRVGDAASVMDRHGPIGEMVSTWKRRAADRLTVCFACTVEHAEHIADAFRAAGVPAAAVDGDTPADVRDATLRDLRAGRLRVLVNVMLLTEGWDLPELGCVQMARPTQSRALWRQMVGRGMRTAEDKHDCIVLDHAGNALRFGSANEDDVYQLHAPAKQQRRAANRSSLATCPHCHVEIIDRQSPVCPVCKQRLPVEQRSLREREALELVAFDIEAERDRLAYFEVLLKRCRRTARGGDAWRKAAGRAAKIFQVHRGAWPDAWVKVATGCYHDIHHQAPSPRLQQFTEHRLRELGLREACVA